MTDRASTNSLQALTPTLLLVLACGLGVAAALARPDAAIARDTPLCANVLGVAPAAPINIEWRAGSLKRFEVTSNDTKARTLTGTLSDLGLRDPAGKVVPTDDIIQLQPPSSKLNAGQGLVFTIAVLQTPPVRPGVYVGSLSLALDGDNEPKGCTTRLAVQLTVPEAEPLADKATLRFYRLLPFPWFEPFSLQQEQTIPVRGPVTSLTLSPPLEAPLGVLQNERGHAAIVYRGAEQPALKDGVLALPLKVQGHTHAGTYEGQLRLNPSGDKAGGMKLSVVVTDIFLWPAVVIGFGVWLALRIQRYVNVERTLWRLLGQEAALGLTFQESQRKFLDAATGTSYAPYSIAADLALKRKALRQSIDDLRTSAGLTLSPADESYRKAVNDFESLRKDVVAWGSFGDELAALHDSLAVDLHAGARPPGFDGDAPALFAQYGALLDGEPVTLAEFAERRQKVQVSAKTLASWYELKHSIDEGEQRHAKLKLVEEQMSPDERAQLASALDNLHVSRLALWEAEDAARLGELSSPLGILPAALDALRKLAAKFGGQFGAGGGVPAGHALAAKAKPEMLTHVFGPRHGDEPEDDAERARFYDEAAASWDRRLTWLAFVIATLTVLHSNYLGKAFGTLKDYAGLLLVGLGTKLVVDTSSAVLGWLFAAGRDGLRRGSTVAR